MGFRFCRRIKLLPGVRINLSRSGVSVVACTLLLAAPVFATPFELKGLELGKPATREHIKSTIGLFCTPECETGNGCCGIPRDASSIAAALSGFLQYGSRVLFVDPFFDLYDRRYKATLKECLRIAKDKNPVAEYEIHYRHHRDNAGQMEIERDASMLLRGVIPGGMTLKIYCWREKDRGADFHARYLLTDRGGIGIDAGFSAEGGHQSTDMHIMDLGFCQERLMSFTRAADVYEMEGPVLLVNADGNAKQI